MTDQRTIFPIFEALLGRPRLVFGLPLLAAGADIRRSAPNGANLRRHGIVGSGPPRRASTLDRLPRAPDGRNGSPTMIKWLLFTSLAMVGVARALPAQCTIHPSLPINAADCGAAPTLLVDQTSALQGAINASCALATKNVGPAPVYIPPGEYLIVKLSIGCSGLMVYGAGSGGFGGGLGGTRLCSSSSTAPMLTVGTPTGPVQRVTLQDFQLSGYCGISFPPGGITMACLYCHVNRVTVTGFNNFGMGVTGAASACCGFDDVNQAEIQVSATTTLPTYAFRVTGMEGPAGGPDGVSVMNSNVNAGCRSDGNGFIDFVTPGTDLASSTG